MIQIRSKIKKTQIKEGKERVKCRNIWNAWIETMEQKTILNSKKKNN